MSLSSCNATAINPTATIIVGCCVYVHLYTDTASQLFPQARQSLRQKADSLSLDQENHLHYKTFHFDFRITMSEWQNYLQIQNIVTYLRLKASVWQKYFKKWSDCLCQSPWIMKTLILIKHYVSDRPGKLKKHQGKNLRPQGLLGLGSECCTC